jgi:hypothetical protein
MINTRSRRIRLIASVVLIISGVVLLAVGTVFVLGDRPHRATTVHNRQSSSRSWPSEMSSSPGISRVTNYIIETSTRFPVKVPASESFAIELTAHIIDVSAIEYLVDPKPGEPGVSIPIRLSAADKEDWKNRASLSFGLDLPGMDFSQVQTLSKDGVARWAVRPKEKGIFVGYITPTTSSGTKIDDASPRTQIRVQVGAGYFTRERILAALAYFFGSLLTLPGLLSFLREFKRAREDSEQKRKSRLIIPS